MTPMMWLLAGLAAARTFRLLTVDGITKPVRRLFLGAMERLAGPGSWSATPIHPRRVKLASTLAEGFFCPFCIGFWIALAWVGTGLAWSDTVVWQLAAGGLAVSYVAGHVTSRLEGDDIDDE